MCVGNDGGEKKVPSNDIGFASRRSGPWKLTGVQITSSRRTSCGASICRDSDVVFAAETALHVCRTRGLAITNHPSGLRYSAHMVEHNPGAYCLDNGNTTYCSNHRRVNDALIFLIHPSIHPRQDVGRWIPRRAVRLGRPHRTPSHSDVRDCERGERGGVDHQAQAVRVAAQEQRRLDVVASVLWRRRVVQSP
jgi:hypothetical protein